MNEMQIFTNELFGSIRTLEENDGKVLFCGSDVAKALGYAKPQNAIATHCKGALKRGIPTNSGIQQMLFITEGDMYRLITHSKLPDAEKFNLIRAMEKLFKKYPAAEPSRMGFPVKWKALLNLPSEPEEADT